MTDQELINQNLQRQIDAQTARIDNVLTKVDMLVIEAQQQREDIRRLNEKQALLQAKTDKRLEELNEKITQGQKEFAQQLHSNFIQMMIGVGAMILTLGGLIMAVMK